jgi:integrase
MATIIARKRKAGTRYTAQIRISRGGHVHSESRTFDRRAIAVAWARRRESELADPDELARAGHRGITVGSLIERYLVDRETLEPLGRSKRAHLAMMRGFALAELPALTLRPADIVEHVRSRRLAGAGGATVGNDVVWLRVVMRYARTALGIPVSRTVVDDAADMCWSERLLARSRRPDRRPTAEELRRLADWFARPRSRPSATWASMYLLMWFSIYSARRLGETCRLRLDDLDEVAGTWLVRDVKNPGGSRGNDLSMLVPDQLWPVIDLMRELIAADGLIAPFLPSTVGTYWQRACNIAGIEDLHWHDLRHEACSRFAEDGLTVPQIQQVSLHGSWSSLQRYVNLRGRPAERVEFDPAHASIAVLRALRKRERPSPASDG